MNGDNDIEAIGRQAPESEDCAWLQPRELGLNQVVAGGH